MSVVVVLSIHVPDERKDEVLARLRALEENPALLGIEFPALAVTVDETVEVEDPE